MSSHKKRHAQTDAPLTVQKVWDIPLRVFHWTLAISVLLGWYYGEFRSFSTIQWHFYAGYVVAALLIFRLSWGYYGPPNAQFRNIFPTKNALVSYTKTVVHRKPSGVKGHNPLGGLSVALVLMALSFQVITGFFAEDDSLFASGPLAASAKPETILLANQLHYYGSRIILGLIILHLCAIAFYHFWKRENLVKAMITGSKAVRK